MNLFYEINPLVQTNRKDDKKVKTNVRIPKNKKKPDNPLFGSNIGQRLSDGTFTPQQKYRIYQTKVEPQLSEKVLEENDKGLKRIINEVIKETGNTPLKNEIITPQQANNTSSSVIKSTIAPKNLIDLFDEPISAPDHHETLSPLTTTTPIKESSSEDILNKSAKKVASVIKGYRTRKQVRDELQSIADNETTPNSLILAKRDITLSTGKNGNIESNYANEKKAVKANENLQQVKKKYAIKRQEFFNSIGEPKVAKSYEYVDKIPNKDGIVGRPFGEKTQNKSASILGMAIKQHQARNNIKSLNAEVGAKIQDKFDNKMKEIKKEKSALIIKKAYKKYKGKK